MWILLIYETLKLGASALVHPSHCVDGEIEVGGDQRCAQSQGVSTEIIGLSHSFHHC